METRESEVSTPERIVRFIGSVVAAFGWDQKQQNFPLASTRKCGRFAVD
jgi:hypothetical protein